MQESELPGLIVVTAFGFLLAVVFYESLCNRDVMLGRALRTARRSSASVPMTLAVYLLVELVAMPILIAVWVVILEVVLFVVGSLDRALDAGVVAAAIVGATRLLTYVHQRSAHELAKALPLAMLFALITGGGLNLDQKAVSLTERGGLASVSNGTILFLIGLEIGLRLATDGSNAILRAVRRRRGIEDDAGVWRTIRRAVRRTPADAGDQGTPVAEGAGD